MTTVPAIALEKLKGLVDKRSLLITELEKPEAEALQALLKKAGYDVGAIDGIVGNRTLSEFAEFKENAWLSSGQGDAQRFYLGSTSLERLIDAAFDSLQPGGKSMGGMVLPVEFEDQRDNKIQPHRTCNTTSCFMAARYLGAKIASDDDFWKVVNRYGDTTSHSVQTKALKEIGIQSVFRTDLDFADLDQSLRLKLPVVISILHRGTLTNPRGGHVICCIGRSQSGDYIFHDPYGSLHNGYTGKANEGRSVIYSRKMLVRRWLFARGEVKGGWGRTFYGNPTKD